MLEKLEKVLREYKSDETLQITESTTFEELDLDSLDTVQLIMDIEEEFDVSIEMDKSIKDIGAVLAVLEAAR